MNDSKISRRSFGAALGAAFGALLTPADALAQRRRRPGPGMGMGMGGGGWVFLGQRQVRFRAEQDTIAVGATDGRFRRIGLEVTENDVEFIDLRVFFANGTSVDVPVRQTIRAGGRTRAIDLPGALRVIQRVRLRYRSAGRLRDGRATVKLYGLR